jgi:glycosyltransferase involved in cell wall biosynthesis
MALPSSKVNATPVRRQQRVVFTVTNELSFDQRMQRICTTLAGNGYDVLLVGRTIMGCPPLSHAPYRQKRLHCFFHKGFLFYVEYNVRLFFFLLFYPLDIIGAIDLDTILPCYLVSRMKKAQRLYDAHELFCEMKEVASRPGIYKAWKWIERHTVPFFPLGYTVNQPIAEELSAMYGVDYGIIRNVPFADTEPPIPPEKKKERYLLYQGSVNEGRSFETLLPAMQWVDAPLIICGDGNFMEKARQIVKQHRLEERVIFKGKIVPAELRTYTRHAWAGITLFDTQGKSNYYSLANRFFDYVQAGIPQLCIAFPVYEEMNRSFPVALLTHDASPQALAKQLNLLLHDKELYNSLSKACLQAREVWNWKQEEKKLLDYFQSHFTAH